MKAFLLPLLCSLFASSIVTPAAAQANRIDFPAASPAAELRQRVGLTDFEIVYSRPSIKGREIFGELQAYGEVWRTGANAATKITFDTPIVFGGQAVAAGTYGLFSVPNEGEWTVILNRVADQWGAFNYDAAEDVLRVVVPSRKSGDPVESFLIWFDDLRDESATLNFAWEGTRVAVPITVDVKEKLVPQIEAVMASGQQQRDYIYFQSAGFYYDHDLDLQKAARWIDLALKQNPNAFWMLHLKAKIHAKLGNKAEAIAAAEASTTFAVAQEGPGSGYKVMNDAIIAELK